MCGFSRSGSSLALRAPALTVLCALTLMSGLVYAQGLQSSPYGASSAVRGGYSVPGNAFYTPQGLAPTAGGAPIIPLSGRMLEDLGILPKIPNLEFSYLYSFGSHVASGRFTADYLLPIPLGNDAVVFAETHAEAQNFLNTLKSVFTADTSSTSLSGGPTRTDVSLGGGWRKMPSPESLVGVNAFFDATQLGVRGQWYSSGSLGLEAAALLGHSDALDLNFNWYGGLFNGDILRNAFRYGPSNFDIEAGYSHETWDEGPDLRLKVTGYKFDVGESVYGWNAGAELKSRDGVFAVKYDVGRDRINRTYHTVGGFVNVGFQLGNLLSGENPFTAPEPIFKSPRNLARMLSQKVKRDWHQPTSVAVRRQAQTENRGDGPAPPAVRFKLTVLTRTTSFVSPETLTGSGTMQMIHSAVIYQEWQLDFDGDVSGLPDLVPVTVTSAKGTLSANTWTWNDQETVVLNFPKAGGGTVGLGGTVLNCLTRPSLKSPALSTEGTLTFTAAGVEPMTVIIFYHQH